MMLLCSDRAVPEQEECYIFTAPLLVISHSVILDVLLCTSSTSHLHRTCHTDVASEGEVSVLHSVEQFNNGAVFVDKLIATRLIRKFRTLRATHRFMNAAFVPALNQINPAHVLTTHFNIILVITA
jgi:hypothetical protein